jgi:hypothetical protein
VRGSLRVHDDATGAYAFGVRAERPAAYGITANGAAVLATGTIGGRV